MRLKEAFLYLEGLGTGYEIDLQNWFLHCGGYGNGNNNDNSKARIISLSLVEELLYEKWWYENFGNDILIEFSK